MQDWHVGIIHSLVLPSPWGWWFITETCRKFQVYVHLNTLLCAYVGLYKL